jgi:hypothetical protein
MDRGSDLNQSGGPLHLSTAGVYPLSVSPDSLGFQLLVRVLATPMDVLGFQPAVLPNLPQLGAFHLERMQLLRRGGAGDSSFVFSVEAVGEASEAQPQAERRAAILKLNPRPLEVGRVGSLNVSRTLSTEIWLVTRSPSALPRTGPVVRIPARPASHCSADGAWHLQLPVKGLERHLAPPICETPQPERHTALGSSGERGANPYLYSSLYVFCDWTLQRTD